MLKASLDGPLAAVGTLNGRSMTSMRGAVAHMVTVPTLGSESQLPSSHGRTARRRCWLRARSATDVHRPRGQVTAPPPMGEDLWLDLARQALARLLRTHGSARFDRCGDAVQEALLDAHRQWRAATPGRPSGLAHLGGPSPLRRPGPQRRHREARTALLHSPCSRISPGPTTRCWCCMCCHPDLPCSGQVVSS